MIIEERNTVFISHATPQDNEFSVWLASRLEMLGYTVWVDKDGLLGGERFWPTIQKAIDKSIKILFVYSRNIVNAQGVLKPGIENELEYGKSVAYQNNLTDFIIPLHIDDSPYHLAIGMPNINHIPFNGDWAAGLRQLCRKLEKDGVPKSQNIPNESIGKWYAEECISDIQIISKHQMYFSTWWKAKKLPEEFYIFRYENEYQAQMIRSLNPDLPLNLNSNLIVTFERNLLCETEDPMFGKRTIDPTEVFACPVLDLGLNCEQFYSSDFPSLKDTRNAYIRLMKSVWNALLRQKGLKKYEMSGKRFAYYRTKPQDNFYTVKIQYPGRQKGKRKNINGKYKTQFWHYAFSAIPIIEPFLCYEIKSHIVFTEDGVEAIKDNKKMHSYRRDKGKRMFNEEWRDLFLAMIQSLMDTNGNIEIKVRYDGTNIAFRKWPEMYNCDLDYKDPNAQMDVDQIADYIQSEEEFDE